MRVYFGKRVGKSFVGASASGKQASNWLFNIFLVFALVIYGIFYGIVSFVGWVEELFHSSILWLSEVIRPAIEHPSISLFALVILPLLVILVLTRKKTDF